MRRRYAVCLPVIAAALTVASPAAGDHDTTPPVVSYTLSGTPGANGWYVSAVTVNWSVSDPQGLTATSGCEPAVLISTETAGTSRTCAASSHGGTTTVTTAQIRIDRTPPRVTGANAARAPDANGWYNQPVGVAFSGTDGLSGIASCTALQYGGPDGGGIAIAGTCTDRAGLTSAAASFALSYDATAPQLAEPVADRKPDNGDWYNHAVAIRFSGSDATSGLEACDAVTYSGPDSAEASVTGACRDRAGNASTGRFVFRYDATAPVLRAVRALSAGGAAVLSWEASPDVAAVEVTRTPGLRGARPAVVYRGRARSFRDARVLLGKRYRYAVTALDPAGNAARAAVGFRLASGLVAPAPGARLRVPPLLRWKAVTGARYYNVQLYRGKRKVLSIWPARPRLRLRRTWSFEGNSERLAPGRYRWYVWPGFGPRSQSRYGRLLGTSTFVVR